MDRCGISYTQDEVRWLVGEIEKLEPFPDVIAALEKLRRAGYKLAILSNGDPDMLQAAGPQRMGAVMSVVGMRISHTLPSSRVTKLPPSMTSRTYSPYGSTTW
jgi:hypothetical protein